ncbi:hypothetical protein HMPREF9418_0174 [Neisseria macacae ATCC 33926]|uniref:Uncharacterized protein n=1 Tax=Neisseria macacae ATCC 33926 TaxID=997348 RepID=A0AA36ULR4_9NEIS|nr:hypothetical protein HMPREF9418_0174 [Neisseria macacae ATCC 33926]
MSKNVVSLKSIHNKRSSEKIQTTFCMKNSKSTLLFYWACLPFIHMRHHHAR